MLGRQSDERLVELVREGNERAFEAIVHRYRGLLTDYCGRIVPESRAEDAVQETYMRAYEDLLAGNGASGELQLRPWLYRIAHNVSLNLLRENGWSHEPLGDDFDGVMRPDQRAEISEQLSELVGQIKALPERQREAIVLREFEGRSTEEIASRLSVTGDAARQLVRRARKTLQAAAAALAPPQLLVRALGLGGGTGEGAVSRLPELAAGLAGGAAAAKAGASLLAVGALVVAAESGSVGDSARDARPPVAGGGAPAAAAPAPGWESPVQRLGTLPRSGPGKPGQGPRGLPVPSGARGGGGSDRPGQSGGGQRERGLQGTSRGAEGGSPSTGSYGVGGVGPASVWGGARGVESDDEDDDDDAGKVRARGKDDDDGPGKARSRSGDGDGDAGKVRSRSRGDDDGDDGPGKMRSRGKAQGKAQGKRRGAGAGSESPGYDPGAEQHGGEQPQGEGGSHGRDKGGRGKDRDD